MKVLIFISLALIVLQSCSVKETITPTILPPCGTHVVSGYTDKTSYFPGDEIEVFLQSDSSCTCGLNFYKIDGTPAFSFNVSIAPQTVSADKPWQNGFGFTGNAKIKLPSNLTSGVYLVENKISFIVKSPQTADVTVVYPINTINAYANSGGKNLYSGNSSYVDRANIVSFLRPMNSLNELGNCSSCLRWPTLT